MAMTYLDHAATTPMRRSVLDAMEPFYTERFANPSGSHRFARDARRAIDETRDLVADLIGVAPGEVIFTGGGTESDNMVVHGATASDGIAVCSAAEHHAVLHPVERRGGVVVGVDATGHIDLEQLASALTPQVSIVSVMAVNNEVGTVTDLGAVARLVRRRAPRAILHTDAVQAAAWMDLRPIAALVDSMSLSGHKLGGPKGVGVVTVRRGMALEPLMTGGGQERERRPGTQNVAGIVGFGAALAATDADRDRHNAKTAARRDRLIDGIVERVPDAIESVPRASKVPGSAHICFPDVESEPLLYLLDQAEVYASAASSCASGAMEPSHVLAAMGIDRSAAGGALRMSLGHPTTDADIDRAIDEVSAAVIRLREMVSKVAAR